MQVEGGCAVFYNITDGGETAAVITKTERFVLLLLSAIDELKEENHRFGSASINSWPEAKKPERPLVAFK